MSDSFFERPIINSPSSRHWKLDAERQPTNNVIETRRGAEL
jgi:hypothetical protein